MQLLGSPRTLIAIPRGLSVASTVTSVSRGASGLQTFTGETTSNVKILKVSESGAASVVVTLPFDEVGGIAITPDGGRLVCTVYSSRSDLWIVENFDVLPSRQ